MKPAPLQPLSSLLQSLAGEAISVQQRLDRHWEAAADVHLALGTRLQVQDRPELAMLHRALTPARLVASHQEFSLTIRMEQGRETGFELKAVPLNLGFAVTHRNSVASSTRLRLQVETVPLPPPPPWPEALANQQPTNQTA